MSYKCPLCLNGLTDKDELVRFCRRHPDKYERIKCTRDNIPRLLHCQRRGCDGDFEIEEGVFLMHVGCAAKNPFWDADKKHTVLPGAQNSTVTVGTVNIGKTPQTAQVQHWEIGMLRVVPNMYQEMWFPLMLLRATGDRAPDGKRVGAMVELSGARAVGKTIIALQSMDYQGYVPAGADDADVRINGFIYSRTPEGSSTIPMLSILHLHTLLRRNRVGVYNPLGTQPLPGDLKAIFLFPNDAGGGPASNGKRAGGGGSFFNGFVQDTRKFFGSWRTGGSVATGRPYWHSLLFYDSAGEDVETETMMPELRAVDKLAVFIDAREVFSGDDTSIEAAVQRIYKNRTTGKKPCALVVTKLDLVFNTVGGDVEVKLRRMTRAGAAGDAGGSRELLVEWLKKNRSGNRQQLLSLLEEDRRRGAGGGNVERVFFVWTENLSETQREDNLQPESHGLTQFVCWCLNRDWAEINHSHGAAPATA